MGKSKKASANLSHEEIWDDSALLRSWDEAVEEYKLYHSIQARGENVEDVVRAAEKVGVEEFLQSEKGRGGVAEAADATDSAGPTPTPESHDVDMSAEDAGADAGAGAGASTTAGPLPQAPSFPQAVLPPTQNEELKNLMMAWYFAGYYTGLYEGQQRTQRTT